MADWHSTLSDPTIDVLPIHFDVPGHHIPVRTFIGAAQNAERIVAELSDQWFESELRYELVVVPPKPGSLIIGLGVVVTAVTVGVWKFLHSDIGIAIVRGLTGVEPAVWAEKAASRLRERIMPTPDANVRKIEQPEPEASVQLAVASTSIILVETTRAFLMTDTAELRRTGLAPQNFAEAFLARNEFYRACADEPSIQAIGFDESDTYPIKRADFARLQVQNVPADGVPNDEPWNVETTVLKVSSPNWDRTDSSRMWKAKDASDRLRNFRVDDDAFWIQVGNGRLSLQGIDTLKVQWAYQGEGKHRRNIRVVKVVEYNGVKLAEPLDDCELNSLLGQIRGQTGQKDFFKGP